MKFPLNSACLPLFPKMPQLATLLTGHDPREKELESLYSAVETLHTPIGKQLAPHLTVHLLNEKFTVCCSPVTSEQRTSPGSISYGIFIQYPVGSQLAAPASGSSPHPLFYS